MIQLNPIGTINPVSKPQCIFNGKKISPEAVALVRAVDPEVNFQNVHGLTPLDYAKICKCDASVVLLSDPKANLCSYCKKAGKMSSCGSCKRIYYCNRDCQKGDWSNHKNECRKD